MSEEKVRETRQPGHAGKAMRKREKPKNAFATIKRILSYMAEFKLQLVIVIFAIILSSLAGVLGNYFYKPIINDFIVPLIGQKSPDLTAFLRMLIMIGAIYLVGVICTYTYNRLMLNISTGVMKKIRTDMFSHMQKLPVKYFDSKTHGELMSRFTNDTDTLREMLSGGIPQLTSSLISVTGVFILMLSLSWHLTIISLLILGVMFVVIKNVGKVSGKCFVAQQKAIGALNGYIEESIEGQKVVKVFCHEEKTNAEFERLNENLRANAGKAHACANILMPILGNLSYFNYAFTSAVGAFLAICNIITVGDIASFLTCTRSFSQPITQISQQFNAILTALAGAERIFALIDEEQEIDEGVVTAVIKDGKKFWKYPKEDGTTEYIEMKGNVSFENVTFGYNENKTILHNVSFWAKPDQKIALVGSTGAGKTTIINLINRFYDINDGMILYDGIDIRNIKKDDLRKSQSMVLQDTNLFTGTVMENIRYGRLSATDEEVKAAARLANADYFINNLPQGYNTQITSNGAELSQGQRQLLAIARAAVSDPEVLILDEATSSIDTRTERLIEKGMDKIMQERTVFVIAHRLSTVRNSNAIMVLEKGKIIERGDHDELLASKGRYYKLYTGAFELD